MNLILKLNFKLNLRLKFIVYNLFIIPSLMLFSFKLSANLPESSPSEPKASNEASKELNDTKIELEDILIIPRIRLTEKNTLKTYYWWESKTPKIPKVYKLILKKMREDFKLETFNVKYVLKSITKDNRPEFNGHYVMFGNLVINSKDKSDYELKDVSFYKVESGNLNLVFIPSFASQSLENNFRSYALNIKANPKKLEENQNSDNKQNTENNYLIVFENELSFDELATIKKNISETLKIEEENISLLYSENQKYTFLLKFSKNPFLYIKDLIYINGPYESEMIENTITFKPVAEKDFVIE